jgi:RecA/RadA recombinase
MSDFLKSMIRASGNEWATVAEDGVDGDVAGFVDTGSYILNGLLSGSILKGGIASNKILGIAGESATGKTYFALGIAAQFLKDNPEGAILYFDSEQAVTSEMITSRGLDPSRVAVFPVATVEQFRHQLLQIIDNYGKLDEKKRKPFFVVLDSLGMLSTSKETNDTLEGKEVRDMTRSQVIKGTFRVLTMKLGLYKIPMVVTNHTYDVVGAYVPTKEMGGGSGLKYAASTIIYLSKKKHKVDDVIVGNIIHCKLYKARFTRENKMVDVLLTFDSGLDRYYGLVDLALEQGVFKKVSTKIELPDGTTAFESQIVKNPTKYFTEDVLKSLEAAAAKEFKYGSDTEVEEKEMETADD